jgi:hypothetical protein
MTSVEWMDTTQASKGGPMKVKVPEIETLLNADGYLRLHEREIRRRYKLRKNILFCEAVF